jgi:hypothetical protein
VYGILMLAIPLDDDVRGPAYRHRPEWKAHRVHLHDEQHRILSETMGILTS